LLEPVGQRRQRLGDRPGATFGTAGALAALGREPDGDQHEHRHLDAARGGRVERDDLLDDPDRDTDAGGDAEARHAGDDRSHERTDEQFRAEGLTDRGAARGDHQRGRDRGQRTGEPPGQGRHPPWRHPDGGRGVRVGRRRPDPDPVPTAAQQHRDGDHRERTEDEHAGPGRGHLQRPDRERRQPGRLRIGRAAAGGRVDDERHRGEERAGTHGRDDRQHAGRVAEAADDRDLDPRARRGTDGDGERQRDPVGDAEPGGHQRHDGGGERPDLAVREVDDPA
jgi:hypothetical protein